MSLKQNLYTNIKTAFLLLSALCFSTSQAQNINTKEVFDNALKYISSNSASINNQILNHNKAYQKHLKDTKKLLKNTKTEKDVLGVIAYYLAIAEDNHQYIYATDSYFPFKTINDTINVKKFFDENIEKVNVHPNQDNELLGEWYYPKENIWINIQKDKINNRIYVGTIIKADKIYAKEGFVKIEFYKNYKNETLATFWDILFRYPETSKIRLKDNQLTIGNHKLYRNQNQIDNFKNTDFEFIKLNEKTNLITLPFFDYEYKNTIDSLLNSNKELLSNTPNLIIDIRGNTGGADMTYYGLIPLMMSEKQNNFPSSHALFLSENNIKNYTDIIRQRQNDKIADSLENNFKKRLNKFQENITFGDFELTEIDKNPENIYILIDEKNASSAEGFILLAKQSAKVKIVGTNTSGTLNFGNVEKHKIENSNLKLNYTQTKVIFKDEDIEEYIGINPDINLSNFPKADWIDILNTEYIK